MSLFLTIMIAAGCTTIKFTVTSEPSGAQVFAGPTKNDLVEYQAFTPFESLWEDIFPYWPARCFQVKKDGYEDSEVVCRPPEEGDRHLHFVLKAKVRPVTRRITSDPPGAEIFWGFNESEMSPIRNFPDSLRNFFGGSIPDGITPFQLRISFETTEIPPCYQVKKEGYKDSEVKCTHPGDKDDRDFHFVLQPLPPSITIVDVFLCDEKNLNAHVSSVRWGQKVLMVIRYTLTRVPEDTKIKIRKYYRISRGGKSEYDVPPFDDQKAAGTYDATLLMTVPTVMKPGEYLLHGIVRMGDQEVEKKFVFTVKQ